MMNNVKSKPKCISELTGLDLQYLDEVASKFCDEEDFWAVIKQFTVLERLNRKTLNTHCLDFSQMNGKDQLEEALVTSLAAEQTFSQKGWDRIAAFFRFLTSQIEERIYAVN